MAQSKADEKMSRLVYLIGGIIYLTMGWALVAGTAARLCCDAQIDDPNLLWVIAAFIPVAAFASWKLYWVRQV